MRLADLDTPAVLVEHNRVRRNISAMQAAATGRGLRLRPHAKTHKSPVLARWQLEAGAVGITVAKVGEAEVFAGEGVEDIRLAYPVPPTASGRVGRLMDRARMSIVVDDLETARRWSMAMIEEKRVLHVLVKVDVGFHRCGIDPSTDEAVGFVIEVSSLPGLELRGLLSHAGQSYGATSASELSEISSSEANLLRTLAARVRARGVDLPELSVGATPTARLSVDEPGLTEIRPGNYVFYDMTQVALGAATLSDCALSVLTTVVSRPAPDRLVLDAGSKTLSSDRARGPAEREGYGVLFDTGLDQALEGVRIERLSEEHGVVQLDDLDSPLKPGDRLRIVPNHSCVVVNLADALQIADGDRILDTIPVAARGKNT